MGMEKQLHLFLREYYGSVIWSKLSEACRKNIETLMAELIIRYLTSCAREEVNHEE
jgi:hypothetical protein